MDGQESQFFSAGTAIKGFNRVEEAVSCFESLSGWSEGCQWSVKGVHKHHNATYRHACVCVSVCMQEGRLVVPILAL